MGEDFVSRRLDYLEHTLKRPPPVGKQCPDDARQQNELSRTAYHEDK